MKDTNYAKFMNIFQIQLWYSAILFEFMMFYMTIVWNILSYRHVPPTDCYWKPIYNYSKYREIQFQKIEFALGASICQYNNKMNIGLFCSVFFFANS